MNQVTLVIDDVVYDCYARGTVNPSNPGNPSPTPLPPADGWPGRISFTFTGPGQSVSKKFTPPHGWEGTMSFSPSCPPGDVYVAFDGALIGPDDFPIENREHEIIITSSPQTAGRGTSGSVDCYHHP